MLIRCAAVVEIASYPGQDVIALPVIHMASQFFLQPLQVHGFPRLFGLFLPC